jgi:hypothetical protein
MLSTTKFCSLLNYVEKNCAQLGYRLDIQGHDKEKNISVYKTDIFAPNIFVFSSLKNFICLACYGSINCIQFMLKSFSMQLSTRKPQ